MLPFAHLEGLALADTSRNAHDDEPSDGEESPAAAAAPATPAAVAWTGAAAAAAGAKSGGEAPSAAVRVRELVVATELAGNTFLSCALAAGCDEVGTVTLPVATTSVGAAATAPAAAAAAAGGDVVTLQWSLRAQRSDGAGAGAPLERLYVTGPTVLGGSGKRTGRAAAAATALLPAGDEWRWVEPVFAAVAAEQVVLLSTVKVSAVPLRSAAEGKPCAPFLFRLGGAAAASSGSLGAAAAACPVLPAPVLLEGLAAAVVGHCAARAVPALALVSLVEQCVDSATVVAFEGAFGLSGGGGASVSSAEPGEAKARRLQYRDAVSGAGKQLDSLYL